MVWFKRVVLATVVLLVVWGEALAQLTFQASVDRQTVAVGEVFTLTVVMSAAELSGAPTPDVQIPGEIELSGQSSHESSQVTIRGGSVQINRTITTTFNFRPSTVGKFMLGPAEVEYQGKQYVAASIQIEVVKSSGKRQTRPVPSSGKTYQQDEIQEIEESLFILAEANKASIYVGEQVEVSYKLYTRYELRDISFGNIPSFTGFWQEKLFDIQRYEPKRVTYDGREFLFVELKRVALFPTTAGKQTLEQLELVCDIVPPRTRRRSPFGFDMFDFDAFDPFRTQRVHVRAEDLEIEVKPLPPGAPAEFGGAVGQLNLEAKVQPVEVLVGDPVSVTVTVLGTGNMNGIPEPVWSSSEGLKIYDPKVSLESGKQGNLFGGRKKFEYVVIPEKESVQRIPAIRLAYFNPNRGRYSVAETAPIALKVSPGENVSPPVTATFRRSEEVQLLGEDIRYIKPDRSDLTNQAQILYSSWWFLLIQGVPAIGFAGAVLYKRHRERVLGDVAYSRRRRAQSEARRRLSEAKRLMEAGERQAFYAEIFQSLSKFLADRTNEPAAGLTADRMAAILSDRHVDEAIIAQIREVVQQCDFARFAPASSESGMAEFFDQTSGLIEALSREI